MPSWGNVTQILCVYYNLLTNGNLTIDNRYSYKGGINFLIYPWHKEGRINGRTGIDNQDNYSVLKKHITSYYKKSDYTRYIKTEWKPANGISTCTIFNGINAANSIEADASGTMFIKS